MEETTEQARKPEAITPEQIIDAFMQENGQLRQQVYAIDRRISKFERIFESAFKQEAEERLGLKRSIGEDSSGCATLSPLGALKFHSSR